MFAGGGNYAARREGGNVQLCGTKRTLFRDGLQTVKRRPAVDDGETLACSNESIKILNRTSLFDFFGHNPTAERAWRRPDSGHFLTHCGSGPFGLSRDDSQRFRHLRGPERRRYYYSQKEERSELFERSGER
jgi:hypothetical protein